MALRFNPPPNWPTPPDGFNPPAGWQPDPAWGPAPEGWQLWVEDSGTAPGTGSAPQAASAPDAGWAPTRAVSTGSSPVADPTGQSAAAPAGDYSATPMGGMGGSAPVAGSAPVGGSAPMVGSAASSAPYVGADYAQSPTPYHSMPAGGGQVPPPGSWQAGAPVPGGPGASKPLAKQWWVWAIIVGIVLVLVIGIVALLARGGSDSSSSGATTRSATRQTSSAEDPTTDAEAPEDGEGLSESNPIDPSQRVLTFAADKYATDPNASIDVNFGEVNWNGAQSLKDSFAADGLETWYEDPPAGKVYLRLYVEVTYHGSGQFSSYDLSIDYVNGGNTVEAEYSLASDEFRNQDMPRDGGKAAGFVTFVVDESLANSGAFAVTAFYDSEEYYVSAE
ncbi:MAG: hypothetical protein Q4C85_02225 [Actinomyces sp.]|uniref:hypothetical protein n=1 Tax=Actinomyces sp. TaxID=29317 RepID=UPI0026DAF05E|nr:hypothetical protein [Actinomyces sp.]MDO4242579.1 hypothetical protein [Actinomyces sp.]